MYAMYSKIVKLRNIHKVREKHDTSYGPYIHDIQNDLKATNGKALQLHRTHVTYVTRSIIMHLLEILYKTKPLRHTVQMIIC